MQPPADSMLSHQACAIAATPSPFSRSPHFCQSPAHFPLTPTPSFLLPLHVQQVLQALLGLCSPRQCELLLLPLLRTALSAQPPTPANGQTKGLGGQPSQQPEHNTLTAAANGRHDGRFTLVRVGEEGIRGVCGLLVLQQGLLCPGVQCALLRCLGLTAYCRHALPLLLASVVKSGDTAAATAAAATAAAAATRAEATTATAATRAAAAAAVAATAGAASSSMSEGTAGSSRSGALDAVGSCGGGEGVQAVGLGLLGPPPEAAAALAAVAVQVRGARG